MATNGCPQYKSRVAAYPVKHKHLKDPKSLKTNTTQNLKLR
jgi:hypothetical protein